MASSAANAFDPDHTPLTVSAAELREMRNELQRFLMGYQFGLREIETKIAILREEFLLLHDYNPIEHVKSRLKTPESVVEKAVRKNLPLTLDAIRENI
ncbi:MAG: hypothetical protein ACK4SE_14325, partial [Brevundimonas sp.]